MCTAQHVMFSFLSPDWHGLACTRSAAGALPSHASAYKYFCVMPWSTEHKTSILLHIGCFWAQSFQNRDLRKTQSQAGKGMLSYVVARVFHHRNYLVRKALLGAKRANCNVTICLRCHCCATALQSAAGYTLAFSDTPNAEGRTQEIASHE